MESAEIGAVTLIDGLLTVAKFAGSPVVKREPVPPVQLAVAKSQLPLTAPVQSVAVATAEVDKTAVPKIVTSRCLTDRQRFRGQTEGTTFMFIGRGFLQDNELNI
jgi:hypothetical protein